ncbi:VPLPA-CTERM sorting domain-containing protein [Roseovarius sp. ZX-A-9]|uniref:VPLPA-CTERM sorting domain-containing protein n=1 Tax=Roseovarius sp. ZX-A-9 TaxID=3014783 RepID=UPI002330636B|nr:VPLPA-CTERM sorting domain-containing protein [Roseovarius sp. ZX-A-9]
MNIKSMGCALFALLFASGVQAATILDQDHLPGTDNGARIGGTATNATTGSVQAQTFTAGLTGIFHSAVLRLSVFSTTTTDVTVGLWSVTGAGTPSALLGSTVTADTSVQAGTGIMDFTYNFSSQMLSMAAGTSYALVATHGEGFGTSWRAEVPGTYTGGQRYSASQNLTTGAITSSFLASNDWDFQFQTNVTTSPVPLPAGLPLLLGGMGLLALVRRRKSA